MERVMLAEKVSFKTRAVKLGGNWLDAPPDLDLKEVRIGKTYRFNLAQKLDGTWYIVELIKD